MENHEYSQGVSSKSLVQRFEKHASQTQDCIVEQSITLLILNSPNAFSQSQSFYSFASDD